MKKRYFTCGKCGKTKWYLHGIDYGNPSPPKTCGDCLNVVRETKTKKEPAKQQEIEIEEGVIGRLSYATAKPKKR